MSTDSPSSHRSEPASPPTLRNQSWLKLAVIQPSPFCNINCDYCYLPDRSKTHRMDQETLQRVVEAIFATDLVSEEITFVWHAGEPLAVPIPWYEKAFELIETIAPASTRVVHSFQSNGILINERWCEFFRRPNVHIGLSLDGPAEVHDAHRRSRSGAGTHAAAMRGAALLQAHGIPFHVIAVVTRESLGRADEIFDFFVEHGIHRFGFNIEELEGAHTETSLGTNAENALAAFFRRLMDRQEGEQGRVSIREFESAFARIMFDRSSDNAAYVYENEQVRPFGILSVDWQGNFSTFSPELLGLTHERFGDFNFGNLTRDSLTSGFESEKFRSVLAEIQAGVERCRATCEYFDLCGGGAPANKLFENGSFDSTETQYCRYAVKVPVQLLLESYDRLSLQNQPATSPEPVIEIPKFAAASKV